jgi:phage terminase large subunit-like protein
MKNAHGISKEDLKDKDCFGGLYTASTESLNVFVLYFPDVNGKKVFLCFTWLPHSSILKNEDKVDYQKWIDEEFIIETPGNSADHKMIARDCIKICLERSYNVLAVGFDKTFGQYVAPDLEAEGIPIMEVYQGFNNLGQQTEELKRIVMKGEIEHFANPVLRWHIANTVTHTNSDGLQKPDKSASGSRIGAVSAMLNAMVTKFNYYQEGVMDDYNFESVK